MQEEIFEMYLDELQEIQPLSSEEERQLIRGVMEGNAGAKKRLIEGKLKQTLLTVKDYEEKGIPVGDLIQEANMALMLMVEAYEGGDFDELLDRKIRERIEETIEQQQSEKHVGEELAARINVLNQVSEMMAEELGREATVKELAEKMKMTEEEVQDIMRLALSAI